MKSMIFAAFALVWACGNGAQAQDAPPVPASYDAELAKSLGADERGMRPYVLVILKTGPNKMPAGPERAKMFAGHMANINRLAGEKKLALAGPMDGVDGLRGLFIMATPDIDVARSWTATDPVIISGEMVAEYHKYYGSAGLMMLNDVHPKLMKKGP